MIVSTLDTLNFLQSMVFRVFELQEASHLRERFVFAHLEREILHIQLLSLIFFASHYLILLIDTFKPKIIVRWFWYQVKK